MENNQPDPKQSLSLSARVLTAFVEKIGEDENFKDIADRLKKTLIDDNKINEANLRQSLFGDDNA